jgi:hypothetical protein
MSSWFGEDPESVAQPTSDVAKPEARIRARSFIVTTT